MEREFVYIDAEKTAIKTNEDGYPMYVEKEEKDGREIINERSADVFHLLDKVHTLGGDIVKVKEKAKSLKNIASVFTEKGILSEEDLASKDVISQWIGESLDARKKVSEFNDKDFDKIKNFEEMKKQLEASRDEKLNEQKSAYDSQIGQLSETIESYKNKIHKLMITDKFSSSKFIKENCPDIPVNVIANTFAGKFKLEEDDGDWQVVGYKASGSPIYSPVRAGNVASFDEALEQMIKEDPNKDFFLKGISGSGTGNGAGSKSHTTIQSAIDEAEKRGDVTTVIHLKREQKKQQLGK